jgi:hypothetical protein
MDRSFLIALFLIASSTGIAAQIKTAPDRDSANILKIEAISPDPKLKIEPVTGFSDKTSLVTNRGRTFKAFILCVPVSGTEGCSSRVFVTEMKTGNTYVITGELREAEVMRPVDELKWLDNYRLSYERWMNPHYGHRYVVNVRTRKQVGAWILSDQK